MSLVDVDNFIVNRIRIMDLYEDSRKEVEKKRQRDRENEYNVLLYIFMYVYFVDLKVQLM